MMRIQTIQLLLCAIALLGCATSPAPTTRTLVDFSTADGDVRLAVSPDGDHAIWGVVVGRDPAQLDLVESYRRGTTWGAARPVPFNTAQTDFDPSFSPDGRSVLFFSSRPGGFGGDDLYVVSFDPRTRAYCEPVNFRAGVNTSGDEWAPMLSRDGTHLLFASNGWGGFGRHDLLIATRGAEGWQAPANLGAGVNTAAEDFDATFLASENAIVFARGNFDDDNPVHLMITRKSAGGWSAAEEIGPEINCAGFVNGPSVSAAEPNVLFFSGACDGGRGRSDLWRVALPRRP